MYIMTCSFYKKNYAQEHQLSYDKQTFCLPGNLNLDLLKASMAAALCWSLTLTDMIGCPMLTRATVPCGLP